MTHALKGVVGSISAPILLEKVKELDKALELGHEPGGLVEEFCRELMVVLEGLEGLGEDRVENEDELEPEQVRELLEQLESRLREDDTSAVGLLGKIRSHFSVEQVGELEEAIGDYEFERALQLLEKLRK